MLVTNDGLTNQKWLKIQSVRWRNPDHIQSFLKPEYMKSVISIGWINGISQFNIGTAIATLYILAVWYIGKGEGYCYYLLKQKIIPRLLVQIEENDN